MPRLAGLVKEADEAMKRGDAQVALAKAQEVLKTNPSQREARAIARKIEEQKVKAEMTSPQLAAALKSTIARLSCVMRRCAACSS